MCLAAHPGRLFFLTACGITGVAEYIINNLEKYVFLS